MGWDYTTRNGQRVQVDVAAAFDRMSNWFHEQTGYWLQINDGGGTRTNAEQWDLYNAYLNGGTLAAKPPNSLHEEDNALGPRALDISDTGPDAGVMTAGSWRANLLKNNAPSFGFSPSGYYFSQLEPWHYEYQGPLNGSGGGNGFDQTVQNEQAWLISRGYNLGPTGADGIAGPMYHDAVAKYQTFLRSYGYTGDSDGIWGAGTQAAHEKYYNAVQNPIDTGLQQQQAFLISRGYDLGPSGADGIWGAKTEAAIKAYQQFLKDNWGYTGDVDGQWGPGTQEAHAKFYASLQNQPGAAPAYPLPAGSYFGPAGGDANSVSGWYSHSEDLKVWQQRMRDRGWPITVDGLYGPKDASTPQGNTYEIALAFQREKGLQADGLIGKETWDAAWTSPVTPADPTPAEPGNGGTTTPPTSADEEAASPKLITPTAADFPKWIKFDINLDLEGIAPDWNLQMNEYYGVPYNPVEAHMHWWGAPGQAGTHDGNVQHLKTTKDVSANFVLSENRITLMVPLNKNALTTGKRNPYAWKVENDPTLSDQQYKTMGYLVYIVEKLNPTLLNEPLRLHKEFYSTSCSEIDRPRVRAYAEQFRTGKLDPATGLPPVENPKPTDPEPTDDIDKLKAQLAEATEKLKQLSDFLGKLPSEFRALASDIDELLK